MGRIGRVLDIMFEKFIRIVLETRFGFNQSTDYFSASGDDSPPMANDRLLLLKIDGTGNFVSCCALSVSRGAKPGEKILYARDSNGNPVSFFKMLNNGKIEINSNGEKAARKGDRVKVSIPAGSFLIAASGGVLNPAPVDVEGTIQDGSGTVYIGD